MARQEAVFNKRMSDLETPKQASKHEAQTPAPRGHSAPARDQGPDVRDCCWKAGMITHKQVQDRHCYRRTGMVGAFRDIDIYGLFSSQDKFHELDICLEGSALKWLTGLPTNIRNDWPLLRKTFLYHLG
jgi:hypothetical protein